MIDANLNRAREAIRTLEDVARFGWNDAALALEAKELRHALQAAVAALPADRLAAARDVAGDVGVALETPTEYARADLYSVAVAAGKRLTEALRAVEEASKTVDPGVARAVEALRYRAYGLDARAALRASLSAPRPWRLCVLVTRALCRLPWDEVVSRAIDGGADAIQVREKEMSARELVAHARAVRAICAPRGVVTVVEHEHPRYVGARIGIYNPAGEKVGRVGRLRNREFLYVVGPERLNGGEAAARPLSAGRRGGA